MENKLVDISDRIKYLREEILNIKQSDMSLKLNLQRSSISDIERKKTKTVTDRVISDICREFSVSETWLRSGDGEVFVQAETFSLDECAEKNNVTPLELDIIKGYIEFDSITRNNLISHFKAIFDKHSEVAATKEEYINTQVENYRFELEAEQKGETLLVSPHTNEKLG